MRILRGGTQTAAPCWVMKCPPADVWLHETLNEIARVRAEHGDAGAFRRMQARAMVVD